MNKKEFQDRINEVGYLITDGGDGICYALKLSFNYHRKILTVFNYMLVPSCTEVNEFYGCDSGFWASEFWATGGAPWNHNNPEHIAERLLFLRMFEAYMIEYGIYKEL